jgi:hypothetical protein
MHGQSRTSNANVEREKIDKQKEGSVIADILKKMRNPGNINTATTPVTDCSTEKPCVCVVMLILTQLWGGAEHLLQL